MSGESHTLGTAGVVSRNVEPAAAAEQLRAIIDSATDAIVTIDDEQRIVLFNAAAERTFACPASEALGQRLDRFLPAGARARHADLIRAFAETGTSTRAMGGERVLSAVRADGTEFPMEAQISHALVGGRRLFTVILHDVTERLRAAEAQARLAAIVEGSDDAIVGKSLEGIVASWNPGAERLFGYSAEEMVGHSIERIIPLEGRRELRTILATIRRGERIEHYETDRVRKDGERIRVSLTISPIRDASGTIVGASKIARDVTERTRAAQERERLLADAQRARAEAEAASRAKDDLLSTVSHELRTPLASILGWTGVLLQGKLSPERATRALRTIERSGRLQAALVDDLLDMSRIASGHFKLERRPLELHLVAQAAAEAIGPEAAAKDIRLRQRCDTGGTVVGDPVRLQQVIANVLQNAVKFTPRGGTVDLDVECEAGLARIRVRDTGRGIAPELLPEIFEPFRQAEEVKTRTAGGLGLGLAIVRSLVEAHDGEVTAESEGVGRGATFTITLPLVDAALADPAEQTTPALPRLDGLRVLVVDDDADACESLATLLESYGARAVAATSMAAAYAAMQEIEPDVLLTDIRTSDGDGHALLRALRARADRSALPAIAVSAYHDEEHESRLAAAGFAGCLKKPVEVEQLVPLLSSFTVRDAEEDRS